METKPAPIKETKIVDQVVFGQGHISRWQAKNGLFVYSQGMSGSGSLSGSENMSENDVEAMAMSVKDGSIEKQKNESQRRLEANFEKIKAAVTKS